MLLYSTLALCAGFMLDLIVGDPEGWPHVVRGIGAFIGKMEKFFYRFQNRHLSGAIMTVLTLFISALIPAAALVAAFAVSPWLYFILEALMCWQILAIKSLRVESDKVYSALIRRNLPQARKAVSMIVGRDTESLDEAGVTRAAVETVAENASDGVASPLFYIMLGGAPLGFMYKAANTLDSMIGYRNERYLDFGRFAAKLDDVLNFIPSRLCALTIVAAAWISRMDGRGALRIWRRDRRNHASPNSAQTEAAAAGALGVRLAGDAYYHGILHEKLYIGDDVRPIEPEDIRRSHRLLYISSALILVFALSVRIVVGRFFY